MKQNSKPLSLEETETFEDKSIHERKNKQQNLSTETSPLLNESNKMENSVGSFRNFFSTTSFAVITFVVMFSFKTTSVSITSLILDKVCLVHLNYSSNVCAGLNNFTDIKALVEKAAANYTLAHQLLKIIPSILVSVAAGQWSDKYGRKPFFLIAIFGLAADAIGGCICAYVPNARVEYYFIGTAIMGMSGGQMSFLIFAYSYISDSTTVQKRTMQYGFLEVLLGLSQPLGTAAGGWIYKFYGYTTVFLVAICGFGFAFIWCCLFWPETKGLDNNDSWKIKIKAFLSCTSYIGSFTSVVKKRDNNGRRVLWMLTIGNSIVHALLFSTHDINFIYAHHQFNWGNTAFSTISAVFSFCGIFTLLILLPILKHFQIKDPKIGMIGCVSMGAKALGIGVAITTSVYYVANALGILSNLTTMAFRSSMSKMIPNDERGKLFSFFVTTESILPIILTVVVTQLFNAFLEIYPGIPYIFLAVLLLHPFATFTWILYRSTPDSEIEKVEVLEETIKKSNSS